MKSKIIGIIIFLFLIIIVNLFLFKDGLWLSQDNSFWYKNNFEVNNALISQIQVFSRNLYYMGYDQGILSFTHILLALYEFVLVHLLGSVFSQIVFVISGYIFTFAAIYLFLKIFFKDNKVIFLLSLLYTFSPLTYTFQSLTLMNGVIPMYIYTFYMYMKREGRAAWKYLFFNIGVLFLIVSYIRFIQIAFFVILVYLFYLYFSKNIRLSIRKLLIMVIFYLVVLSPIILAVIWQFAEGAKTAFYYSQAFENPVSKINFYYVFDLLKSYDLVLYEGKAYLLLGFLIFIFILGLIIRMGRERMNFFYFINIFLILFGMLCFGLANILGDDLYIIFIRFLPFLTHSPWWALYILNIPLVVLIGLMTLHNKKNLYWYSIMFLILSIWPYVVFYQHPSLMKFRLADLPKSYREYFFADKPEVPTAANYILNTCWRAQYMDEMGQPTHCINFGLRLSPIAYDNPRLLSDKYYQLSKELARTSRLDNFRITHNLKHIIVPNDTVHTIPKNLLSNDKTGLLILDIKKSLENNGSLELNRNDNFDDFVFKESGIYDFFIYSPKTIVKRDLKTIFGEQIDIRQRPVILNEDISGSNFGDTEVFYKSSPTNYSKYYLKLSDIKKDQPIAIQMNQTFYPSWKAFWIDKEDFDKIGCQNDIKSFSITNNKYCVYNSSGIEPGDISILTKKKVEDKNHFEGNLIGNTWVINQSDIPEEYRSKKDVYLVLVYEKQIYYLYLVTISFISVIIFAVIIIAAEFNKGFMKV